jgi:ferritin-like protein
MCEELEAIDWYNQRADVADDEELRNLLVHNRDEEIEHAIMLLEWLRRRIPQFDEELRTYLFKTAPVTEIEEEKEQSETASRSGRSSSSLGIGALHREEANDD